MENLVQASIVLFLCFLSLIVWFFFKTHDFTSPQEKLYHCLAQGITIKSHNAECDKAYYATKHQ